ncbi:MAG: Rrf2 family transcriptional regulator [Oscillospiraceae bacterium]|jgi:Rrf2 family protein|nr:Rrf2 family transcriptional regulator [Oscillospiraceae bacterium]
MKISTKTRHALRMMLDFAAHQNDGFISLKEISTRMNVSKTYLEQIMIHLNKTDMLTAARGASGGYKLSRPADKYSVGEIFRAIDGNISLAAPDPTSDRSDIMSLTADEVWSSVERLVLEYLDSVTLQDIIEKSSNYLGYDYNI